MSIYKIYKINDSIQYNYNRIINKYDDPIKNKIEIQITIGDGNEVIRGWEKYTEAMLNKDYLSVQRRVQLILTKLRIIYERDNINNTQNYMKIHMIHKDLIDAFNKLM